MIFQMLLLLLPSLSLAEKRCNLIRKPLSCKNVVKILNYHNEMRNLVASGETNLKPAKDMWVLKWDKELADEAQKWANECKFTINDNKAYQYGENLASYTTAKKPKVDVEHLVRIWFDEIKNYNPEAPVDQYNAGYFTQFIWANTKFIGCGISSYRDERNKVSPYKTMLICNYKPPGNHPDEKPYEPFDRIRCERGTESKVYTALCG
ncbi:unnamed protein product [Nezara viridula]|uniref:SCP domain-containing protein n=1 Tax=Nezara viridula TaxID=85310 RepID=A0A9P0HTA7_NEZVI|nr:unnamed protein product [Nezara viridula]